MSVNSHVGRCEVRERGEETGQEKKTYPYYGEDVGRELFCEALALEVLVYGQLCSVLLAFACVLLLFLFVLRKLIDANIVLEKEHVASEARSAYDAALEGISDFVKVLIHYQRWIYLRSFTDMDR